MTRGEVQEARDAYKAEVARIVELVLTEIRDGSVASRDSAIAWATDLAEISKYAEENEHLCIHTLLFSQHACQAFDYSYAPRFLLDAFEMKYDSDGQPRLKGCEYGRGDAFPFAQFAFVALAADVQQRLEQTEPYKELS
jgi:hypothetical protein